MQNLRIRRTYYTGEVPKDRANVPVMGQCFSSATRRQGCRPMLPVSTNGEYHVELGNMRSVRGKFKPLKGRYLAKTKPSTSFLRASNCLCMGEVWGGGSTFFSTLILLGGGGGRPKPAPFTEAVLNPGLVKTSPASAPLVS